MTDNIQISIAVCTYNRSDLLAQVLETLCTQTAEPSTYEIIIVDNNSKDDTATVTATFAAKYSNVRYCLESNPGLSHARNRGWQEARGAYVAYIDDDCKVPPQWVTTAQTIIAELKPTIFGGPYFAFYATRKPTWFKDAYGSSEVTKVARPLLDTEFVSGGNMVIERQALATSGGFRGEIGMKGDLVAYGDETVVIIHIRKTMPNVVVYYDPKLYVFHLVRPEKMRWPQIVMYRFVRGRDTHLTFNNNNQSFAALIPRIRILLKAFIYFLYLLFDALVLVWLRNRDQYHYIQNYWYEHSLAYIGRLGESYAKIKQQQ